MAFALLAGARWGLAIPESPIALAQVVACGWIFVRSTGACGGSAWTLAATILVVTLQAVCVLFGEPRSGESWLLNGPLSPRILLAVSLPLLLIELADLGWRLRSDCRSGRDSTLPNVVRFGAVAFLGLFVLTLSLVPLVTKRSQDSQSASSSSVPEEMTPEESLLLQTTQLFCASVFASLGATVGSFLNVVAWRLPRGESVVLRRSRCPACDTPILPRDNLPILGWLLLRGRCRSCDGGISWRYPAVELLMLALFLLLYFRELLSGGANLPGRIPNTYTGVVWIIFYTKWDLIVLYLFHTGLLCVLVTWGLIEQDLQTVPRRTRILLPGLALLLVCAVPVLSLVPLAPTMAPGPLFAPWIRRGVTALVGGLAGWIVGWWIDRCETREPRSPATTHWSGATPAGLALLGIGLGWQASIAVSVLLMLLRTTRTLLGERLPPRLRWGPAADLALVAVVHQVWWRNLVQFLGQSWPIAATRPGSLLAVAIVVGWCAVRFMHRPTIVPMLAQSGPPE